MPTTYAAPTLNPLVGPSVSGTSVTVDVLLNSPTRVNRIVADLTMSTYFLDSIFASAGGVEGGAVLYDQANYLNTYTDRDVARIEPGDEAPIVTALRTGPLTAQVEKFGGKFPTNREARRRNNMSVFTNATRQLANTITRKLNQRGMAELAAAISTYSRTASGVSWSDAEALTFDTTAKSLLPGRDFAASINEADTNEMGYVYNTLIVHPDQAESLGVIYEDNLDRVLSNYGITDMIVTPRKATGSAYLLAGPVGEIRLEEPLRTTIADESTSAPSLVERTWTQTLVNPVMYVTDPYAILEITGLAA